MRASRRTYGINLFSKPSVQLTGSCSRHGFNRPFHQTFRNHFLDDLLKTVTGNGEPQNLKATRRLPYPASSLFKIVASIDTYPSFLPFIHSSTILTRDKQGWPSRATLNVGYAGYEETFTSQVDCDETKGNVRARSGDSVTEDQAIKNEGLFQALDTHWQFEERSQINGDSGTEVTLTVKVKFRNPVYDAFLSAVEHKIAGTMIEAFEKRLQDVEGR